MPSPQWIPARQQSGFTLVEAAGVLIVIGLILGSVLKTQELMNSAMVKSLANDFRTLPTHVRAYQGRFRALPGDDGAALHNAGGTSATTPGNTGDGRINGHWNSLTATDESYLLWQHLRKAGLIGGNADALAAPSAGDAYAPRNAVNGRLGVTSDTVASDGHWLAGQFFVCSSGIRGRLARQIDGLMDDGNTLSGAMRAICEGECATGPGVDITGADEVGRFTLCAAF